MDDSDPKIQELLANFLDELMAGAKASEVRERLVREHADLQPELERRLRFAETVFALTKPGAEDETKSLNDNRLKPTSHFVPEESVQRLNCPHCGIRINLVEVDVKEVTCVNCGSLVTIGAGQSATQAFRQVPSKIGRFKVLSFLGSGGFGTAYLAYDPTLDRNVALKIPRAGEFASRNDKERFVREAKNAAKLRHDNIVQVHEINSEGDYPYIVSEYIDGMTLAERISGLAVAHQEIARLMILVAEAVHYAHQQGIIHRDLKPSNIFLNSSFKPYVADFGLARNLMAEHTMTLEGEILGTPAYMPPEQANGDLTKVSARSDVYSLGVILYRMLCGENPFRACGRMLIHQVIHEDPVPPRRINDRIPVDLETITLKAMHKNPDNRYESAKELADDLRSWQNDQAIKARPESSFSKCRRWCRKNPRTAGLLGVVAGLLLILSAMSAVWAIREKLHKEHAVSQQRLAETKAHESQSRLVDAEVQSSIRHMEQGVYSRSMLWTAQALRDSANDTTMHRFRAGMLWKNHPRLTLVRAANSRVHTLDFSSDGSFLLAGTVSGELLRISPDRYEESPLVLTHPGLVVDIKAAANVDRLLSFSKESRSVQLCRLSAGTIIAELQHAMAVTSMDVSPDGLWVATSDQAGTVKVWSTDTGAMRFEFPGGTTGNVQLKIVNESQLLVHAKCHLATQQTSLTCWNIREQSSEKVFDFQSNIFKVEVVPSTKLLLVSEVDGAVKLYDLSDGQSRGVTLANTSTVNANYVLPDRDEIISIQLDGTVTAWSSDGHRKKSIRHAVGIVDTAVDRQNRFLAIAGTDGLVTVYWLHLLQRIGTHLVADQSVSALAFHPDGRRLAAGGSPGTIRMWDLAGLAPDVPLLQHDGAVVVARFSPTGDSAITASRDHSASLWNTQSGQRLGEPIRFSQTAFDVAFDKHGRLAAAGSLDKTVKVVNAISGAAVGEPIELDDAVTKIQFSPSEAALLLVGCADGILARIDAPNSQIVYKSAYTKSTITDLQFAPDGTTVIVGSTDKSASLRAPADGKVITPPLTHLDVVTRCGFSTDGRTAWTCSTDRKLRRWKTTSPFDVRETSFTSWPTCVAYTSKGTYLTITYEGEIALWSEDKPLWQSNYRAYRFLHCQVDVNEQFALVAGELAFGSGKEQGGGVAILLDLQTGLPVAPPLQHFGSILRAYFDPTGQRVLTASEDHSARIWKIAKEDRSVAEIQQQAVILCGAEIDSTSQMISLEPRQTADLFAKSFKESPGMFACQVDEIDRWDKYVTWVLQLK